MGVRVYTYVLLTAMCRWESVCEEGACEPRALCSCHGLGDQKRRNECQALYLKCHPDRSHGGFVKEKNTF